MTDPFGYCAEPECHDEPELPTVGEMVKGLAGTAGDVVKGILRGEGAFVTEAIHDERMTICKGCEFFRQSDQRCSQCGCYMQNKTKLKKAHCPVHKWGAVE
jgi:hypothetical protein